MQHDRSVILGGTTLTSRRDDDVTVPNLSIYGTTYISGSLGTGSLIDNLGQSTVGTTTEVQHIVYCTQAEYDGLTPDINTLYVISGSGVSSPVNTLTDVGGTTTLDCSLGNYFTLAMPAGTATNLVPTNIQTGQTIKIQITQNATPSTLTYDSAFKFPGGVSFTISSIAGDVDVLTIDSLNGTTLNTTGVADFK